MAGSGNTRYRPRVRCNSSKCRHRFTLKRKPLRLDMIECPICCANVHSCEGQRRRELETQERCNCYAIPFPHRKGSVLGCDHHLTDPNSWTIDQERQYQGMMETPRSG